MNTENYDRTTSFESILIEEPLKLISLSDIIIEEKANILKKQKNMHNSNNKSFCFTFSFWRYVLCNDSYSKR